MEMLIWAAFQIVLDGSFNTAFQVGRQIPADSLALANEREDLLVGPADFFEAGAGSLLVELIDFLRPGLDSRPAIFLVESSKHVFLSVIVTVLEGFPPFPEALRILRFHL